MTIPEFQQHKRQEKKLIVVTAYDALFTRIVEQAGINRADIARPKVPQQGVDRGQCVREILAAFEVLDRESLPRVRVCEVQCTASRGFREQGARRSEERHGCGEGADELPTGQALHKDFIDYRQWREPLSISFASRPAAIEPADLPRSQPASGCRWRAQAGRPRREKSSRSAAGAQEPHRAADRPCASIPRLG